MSGLVSVIIPTYNRRPLLQNAVGSVFRQTYPNYEIIIVDDHSTDDTQAYVAGLESDKIRYFRNEVTLKAPGSRNRGIEEARGEFIAFLDDDDEWFPNKLEKQMQMFNNPKVGLAYCGVELYFEMYDLSYCTVPTVRGNVYKQLLIDNCIGVTPSVVIRKAVLANKIWFDTKLPGRQDYDFWIRVAKCCEIDYVRNPLLRYNYRINMSRISTNIDNYVKAIERLNCKYEAEVLTALTPREQRQRLALQQFFLGAQAIKAGNAKLARKYFLEAYKINSAKKALLAYLLSLWGIKATLKFRYYLSKIRI